MTRFFLRLIVLACALFLTLPVQAADKGLAQRFDWVAAWGSILPDTIIPSTQMGAKGDIRNAVENCGLGDTNYGKVGSYLVDFNGDGRPDYVTEARGYFGAGYNKLTCPFAICSATRGCNISIYAQGPVSQIMRYGRVLPESAQQTADTEEGKEGEKKESAASPVPVFGCPANPADNTACRQDCPAIPANCPALFTYYTGLEWDGQVFDWSFIAAAHFDKVVREANKRADGTYKHRSSLNDRPIFVSQRAASHCTLEEMDANNNNVVESTEVCVKYLQHSNGRFVDLYAPAAYVGSDERDERMTTEPYSCQKARVRENAPAKATSCTNAGVTFESDWRAADKGLRLETKSKSSQGFMAYQIANFSDPAKPDELAGFICKEVRNNSGRDLLVPQRTDVELASFHQAAASGAIDGVSVADCARRFTAWSGQTSCPALSCDETRWISAQRNCQRSTSSYALCAECAKVADPNPIRGFERQCTFSALCSGPPCPSDSGGGDGGGGDCLAAGAQILMADGSLKPIEKIVIGDAVMGFDKNAPLAAPKKAVVKALRVTDALPMVEINGLKVSPNHLLSVQAGKILRAGKIQTGSQLVGTSGQSVSVSSLRPVEGKEKSYNLDLDGADGFIANGLRVMKEPLGD